MRTRRIIAAATLGVLAAGLIGGVVHAEATLTLMFREMTPHVDQPFHLRVVDATTGVEVIRLDVPEVPAAAFDLSLGGMETGGSYRIDFFIDVNRNGRYDAPPADHAWRLILTNVRESGALTFTHNTDFVDIDWPPRIDGEISDGEYRNAMIDSATGIGVHWQNDDSVLYVGLIGPGTGWVAIGFEPEQRMLGASIVLAAVAGGDLTIEEHFGTGPTSHRGTGGGEIIQAAGTERDGRTIIEFAIPLVGANRSLSPGEEAVIILAYHRSSDSLTQLHTARTTTRIRLDQ